MKSNAQGRGRHRAFTLLEMMIALSITALVFAGLCSAYIFLGRNLTRLSSFEKQQMQARRTLQTFARDVSEATAISAILTPKAELTIALPGHVVVYSYEVAEKKLNRQLDGATPVSLLTDLTEFSFAFYDKDGNAAMLPAVSTKQVQINFVSAMGNAANGTRSTNSISSAAFVLRNKPYLGQ